MRGYFYTLLAASVTGAFCTLFAGRGFEKHMKYVCSLICTALMILPLAPVFSGVLTLSGGVDGAESEDSIEYAREQAVLEAASVGAEEYISGRVFAVFGIKPLSVSISMYQSEGGAVIEDVTVVMPPGSDVTSVRNALYAELGGEVTVIEG